jgi:hypothetical protein
MKKFIYILVLFVVVSGIITLTTCKSTKDVNIESVKSDSLTSHPLLTLDSSFKFEGMDLSDTTVFFNPKSIEVGSANPNDNEGIGLGNIGTMGHGSGSGQGFGSGHGRLGDSHNPMSGPPMGYLTYYIPDTMKVGTEYKVQLRISKHNTVEFHYNMDTNSVKKQIRVGSSMETKLIDVDNVFQIITTDTPVQTIENDSSYTEWTWYITPQKGGRHLLKLVVTIKEDNLTKDIPVYEDKIYIQASPLFTIKGFFIQYWQYLLGVVGTVFAWWYTNMRRKKKKARL